MSPVNVDLNGVINTLLPTVFELIKSRHAHANPGAPLLTDEQVKEGLRDAVSSSLAEDDRAEADIRSRNPPQEDRT